MTGEAIGDRAQQLRTVADAVPVQTAGNLCDQVEAVRDQLAEITGPESDIIGQTQQVVSATTDVIRALVALRTKIAEVAEHHQGGGAGPPSSGGNPTPAAPAQPEQQAPETVADEEGGVRSFPSFTAAKRTLGKRPGHELHHIVEQSQTKDHRSGFSTERINTTNNLIFLPVEVHRRITRFYASKPLGGDSTRRDSLNGTSWDHQYRRGMRAVRRALRGEDQDDRTKPDQ
ncbi:hypothetical protein [Saccharopolyspora sp. ASAGF58]|uniref:hypothetical protein n=1 Tax=Saccharopolyspora sp. ASAGF58 TaxID=2719023 RepID=UPI00143FD71B|nr:hypothetical protein [Saccharopolyspora sp. ASAGF58]QIZ38459.1 hypothetical protein FDZ84_32925 [Saccharopolyspora sp. ASAGF58]